MTATWTPRTPQAEAWIARTEQGETWTPRTQEAEAWTESPDNHAPSVFSRRSFSHDRVLGKHVFSMHDKPEIWVERSKQVETWT